MRNCYYILILVIVSFSCKTTRVDKNTAQGVDTIKFTYMYSEALKNKMLGQNHIAQKQFEECLRINPSSTASAYQLAEIFFLDSNYVRAKDYSELCISKKPDQEWYILQRAKIAKVLNEKEVYQKLYEKLVHLNPDNLDYVFENAIILYQNRKFEESLVALKNLEEEIGINENISFLRNNIYFSLKRLDAIQFELIKLRRNFPDSTKYADILAEFYVESNQGEKAFNLYKEILTIDTINGYANIGIAWISASLGNYIYGFPYLMKGLLSSDVVYARKSKVADAYLNPKSNLNVDSLAKVYEILIASNTDDIAYLNRYLKFLNEQKRTYLVENLAKKSIAQNPDNFTAWDFLLNTLLTSNKISELKDYSLKALEYFPNHALIFFYNGYSNFALANYNEAINYLEIGIDFVSDDTDLEKQFLIYLAESYHKISKNKQSDSYFDRYLKLDSTNAYVLNNYAFYLAERNLNVDKALVLSRKAIEIEPFNSNFLDTYAWILFLMSDYDKSIGFIERAYKYGGNSNPVVVEHYGDILMKKNKVDEALERWKEAYSLNRKNTKLLEKINKTELEN